MNRRSRDAGSRKRTMAKRVAVMVCLMLAVTVTAAWATHTFSDVPDDHPQAADIAYAVEKGWFQGYDDGTFRPDNTLIDRPRRDRVPSSVSRWVSPVPTWRRSYVPVTRR